MKVTEVRIKDIREAERSGRLRAVVSVTLDNEFVIHDIKIIENSEGNYFITMPSVWDKEEGRYRDVAHPINARTREMIQNAILEEYIN